MVSDDDEHNVIAVTAFALLVLFSLRAADDDEGGVLNNIIDWQTTYDDDDEYSCEGGESRWFDLMKRLAERERKYLALFFGGHGFDMWCESRTLAFF